MPIKHKMQKLKNFENWSVFGKNMDSNIVASFFRTQCIITVLSRISICAVTIEGLDFGNMSVVV